MGKQQSREEFSGGSLQEGHTNDEGWPCEMGHTVEPGGQGYRLISGGEAFSHVEFRATLHGTFLSAMPTRVVEPQQRATVFLYIIMRSYMIT